MVQKVTGVLHAIFCKPFIVIWGIIRSIAGFLWTVITYLWDVGKAKKQGWCPYVRFEDAESYGEAEK